MATYVIKERLTAYQWGGSSLQRSSVIKSLRAALPDERIFASGDDLLIINVVDGDPYVDGRIVRLGEYVEIRDDYFNIRSAEYFEMKYEPEVAA